MNNDSERAGVCVVGNDHATLGVISRFLSGWDDYRCVGLLSDLAQADQQVPATRPACVVLVDVASYQLREIAIILGWKRMVPHVAKQVGLSAQQRKLLGRAVEKRSRQFKEKMTKDSMKELAEAIKSGQITH